MKKRMFKLFSLLALFAFVFTLVSCKPDNGEEAKERLEEAGYKVVVVTGSAADAMFMGVDGVNEIVVAGKSSGESFVAILFDSKDAAKAELSDVKTAVNTEFPDFEIHHSGKWVYYGSPSGIDAFE